MTRMIWTPEHPHPHEWIDDHGRCPECGGPLEALTAGTNPEWKCYHCGAGVCIGAGGELVSFDIQSCSSTDPALLRHCYGCGTRFAWNERRLHITPDPSTDAWLCVRCAGEDPIDDAIECDAE